MKDAALEKKIEQLKNGDARAFDHIYDKTNRSVYFTLLYILRDRMYAEDILQETYVRALRSLDSYTADTNFVAWLTRIAKNLAFNHLKRAAREVATDFEADAYKFGSQETELPYIFETAARVLAEDEYEILMLCHVSGYKRKEVAAMLGMPIGTVTWKNNEALKKLKKHLQKEGDA